ncbi:MAG: hypothetical protein DRO93_04315 [Candidatus Thorarchaeota archaeon]|nr:MAG: hypothetical protein DRO93_04315 [Candidatus Thorarchaeota archaeon]
MQTEIRPIRREDVVSVYEIEKTSFAEPWSIGIFRLYAAWRGVVPLDEERTTYANVAVHQGVVLGYIVWETDRGHRTGRILNIAVREGYRRRGIGRTLIQHAFEAMRRAGLVQVELEARESNTAARGLYSHLGMIEVGRLARYYHNEDAVVYRIEL